MDILITCLSLSFKQFAISCKYIISKYGLIKIYEMTKDILEKCYQDIQSLSLTQAYKNTATNELLIILKWHITFLRWMKTITLKK